MFWKFHNNENVSKVLIDVDWSQDGDGSYTALAAAVSDNIATLQTCLYTIETFHQKHYLAVSWQSEVIIVAEIVWRRRR